MKLNRRQVIKAGLAASTVYSPWMLGIAQSKPIIMGGLAAAASATVIATQEASEDAKAYINENGGINGRKIEFASEDTGGDPAKGMEALGKLLTREPDTLFLSTDSGPLTLALAPELKRLMMPYLTASYLKALANRENFPSVFLTGPTFDEMMLALLQGIKQQKSNATIAIIHPPTPFGVDALPAFKEQAAKDGHKIVLDEVTGPAIADASPIVPKLLQANPDFVVLQGYVMSGEPAVIKAARAQGLKSVFMGTYWSSEVGLTQLAGPAAADGFIVANHCAVHTDAVPGLEEIRKFRASKGRTTTVLSNLYLYEWRNTLLRAEAIRRADAAGKLTRAGVVEAMENLGNYNAGGLFRDLKFVNHRLPYTKLYLLDAAGQKFVAISDWINFS